MASWTFSQLESGLVRLASDAGHILDIHPAALLQMTASELLLMLERRVADAVVSPAPAAAAESPAAAAESPAAPDEGASDGGQA